MPADSLHISPARTDTVTAHRSTADSTWSPASFGHPVEPFHELTDTLFTRALAADSAAVDTVATAAVPDWHSGLLPEPRPMQPGNRTGFLILVALMFVVMTFNFRHFGRLVAQYFKDVYAVRSGRDNVFDDHTAADSRVLLLLLMQCIVCVGILVCAGVCRIDLCAPALMTGRAVGFVIALCAVWYLLQLAAYSAVGYVFAPGSPRREWLRGFNASQGLLGLALVLPAVAAVFYPPFTAEAVVVAAALYVIARVAFIIKGFRIFYNGFGSLLYFILYLCTLEIIPVICIYECSRLLIELAE